MSDVPFSTYHYAPDGEVSVCGRIVAGGQTEDTGFFTELEAFVGVSDPVFAHDVRCEGCKAVVGISFDPEPHHLRVVGVSLCGRNGPWCDPIDFVFGWPGLRCLDCASIGLLGLNIGGSLLL